MLGKIALSSISQTGKTSHNVEGSTRLQEALIESLGGDRAKGGYPKDGDKFRSSGLGKMCPRMYALAQQNKISLDLDVDSRLAWVFGTGHAIHHQFQSDYLSSLGNVFQGWWRKVSTGKIVKGAEIQRNQLRVPFDSDEPSVSDYSDIEMDACLSHSWIPKPTDGTYDYVELEFKRERFSGHCDGVLV